MKREGSPDVRRSVPFWSGRFLCAAVGFVFLVAAAAKWHSWDDSNELLAAIGWPAWFRGGLSVLVPGVELAIGAALFLGVRPKQVAALTVVILGVFSGFIIHLTVVDPGASCSCFGGLAAPYLSDGPMVAIGRNVVLAAFACLGAWLVARGRASRGRSVGEAR